MRTYNVQCAPLCKTAWKCNNNAKKKSTNTMRTKKAAKSLNNCRPYIQLLFPAGACQAVAACPLFVASSRNLSRLHSLSQVYAELTT